MHLQMFLLQAEAQKKASEQEGSILIDTQRATEEVVPVVVGGEEDLELIKEAEMEEEEQEQERRALEEQQKSGSRNGELPYTVVADGIELGDGTPGGLMDDVLSEYVLGRFVGAKWQVNEVMLYDPGNVSSVSRSFPTYSSLSPSLFFLELLVVRDRSDARS